MKVIAINGSARIEGNTHQALRVITAELDANGIETAFLHLGGQVIRGCTGCGACATRGECVFNDDAFRGWLKALRAADGILLGSPVYYAAVAGTLKAFLDRAFFQSGPAFRHKVGGAVAVARRSGGMPTVEQLNNYFLISEMIIAPSFYWTVAHGRQPGDIQQDAEALSVLKNLGRNMAWLLRMKNQTHSTLPPPEPVKRDWTNFIR